MPLSFDRKVLWLGKTKEKQAQTWENNYNGWARSAAFRKKYPEAEKYRKNFELLERYQAQLQNKGSGNVTRAQAQKAWNEVKSFCQGNQARLAEKLAGMAPNDPDREPMQKFVSVLTEHTVAFQRIEAQERKFEERGNDAPQVFPDETPVAFSPEEAVPYFKVLADRDILDKMDDLAEGETLSAQQAQALRDYRSAVSVLTLYAAEKSQGHPVDDETERLAGESWAYLRDHSRQLVQELSQSAASLAPDDPRSAAVREALEAVSVCRNAVAYVESRELRRRYMAQDAEIAGQVRAAMLDMEEYDAGSKVPGVSGDDADLDTSFDLDDELELEGESVPLSTVDPVSAEIQNMQGELTNYRWKMYNLGVTFENDYPEVNRQLHALYRQLPVGVLERFRNIGRVKDFVTEMQELPLRRKWEEKQMIGLTREVDGQTAELLNGEEMTAQTRQSVRERLQVLFYQNGGDAQRNAEEIRAYLAQTGMSAQTREKLEALYAEKAPQYAGVRHDLDVTRACIENQAQLKEMKLLEGRRAVLLSGNPRIYEEEYARFADQAANPVAALRGQLGALAAQMNGMHKAGRNTAEYRQFREALNQAATTGDLAKLRQLAEVYRDAKTAGGKSPTSSWGIGRLNVANDVIALLDDNAALTGVQMEPLPRPQVPQERPQSSKPWVEEEKARREEQDRRLEQLKQEQKEQEKREQEERERRAAQEEKAREERRAARARQRAQQQAELPPPVPMDFSGEMEPPVPYQMLKRGAVDEVQKGLEVWIRNHFDHLPPEQADRIGRKAWNMMTRCMTGKPGDFGRFQQEFDREFTDRGRWRPPLRPEDDMALVRLTLGGMVAAYTEVKARQWLQKVGNAYGSDYSDDYYANRQDLYADFKDAMYHLPGGAADFARKHPDREEMGRMNRHLYDVFKRFIDNADKAARGEPYEDHVPWDEPLGELYPPNEADDPFMDRENEPEAANVPQEENPFDKDPFDDPFDDDPFDQPEPEKGYVSLTMEHQEKFIKAQWHLERLKGEMTPAQRDKAKEFLQKLDGKLNFASLDRDICVGEALLIMDGEDLQQAADAYAKDKNVLHAVVPPEDGLSGRERMQRRANREILEKLVGLPEPANDKERDFNRQLRAILKKGNEADPIRQLLGGISPEVLQAYRSFHGNGNDLERQMNQALAREQNSAQKKQDVPEMGENKKEKSAQKAF